MREFIATTRYEYLMQIRRPGLWGWLRCSSGNENRSGERRTGRLEEG
jgi:hypothetical protein